MSDQITIEQIRQVVKEEVAANPHVCYLDDSERRFVHSLSDSVARDKIASLVGMIKFWDLAGAWIGRLILAGLLALIIWGITALGEK